MECREHSYSGHQEQVEGQGGSQTSGAAATGHDTEHCDIIGYTTGHDTEHCHTIGYTTGHDTEHCHTIGYTMGHNTEHCHTIRYTGGPYYLYLSKYLCIFTIQTTSYAPLPLPRVLPLDAPPTTSPSLSYWPL